MSDQASNILAGQSSEPCGVTIAFDDVVLVERCRKGQMQAFGLLVAKYQDRVLNTILRLCGNQADAEELAQETFVKALGRLAQFRGQSQFYTWLFRIAVNLALTHRRRGGRIRFTSLSAGDGFDDTQAGSLAATMASRREPSPPSAAMAAEVQCRVLAALEELDDDFRTPLVLRDLEDMDYAQIAQVLDLPAGTVKSRIHRGRAMLKDKLADLI